MLQHPLFMTEKRCDIPLRERTALLPQLLFIDMVVLEEVILKAMTLIKSTETATARAVMVLLGWAAI